MRMRPTPSSRAGPSAAIDALKTSSTTRLLPTPVPRPLPGRPRPRRRARRSATHPARAVRSLRPRADPAPSCGALRADRPAASRTNLEPGGLRLDRPRPPGDRSLEPERVVLAHRADAVAEVGRLGAVRRAEQLPRLRSSVRGRRGSLVGERQQVGACARVEPLEQRQDLRPDQPALRPPRWTNRSGREPVLTAVRLGLLAPDAEQRAHHPVLAHRLDPLRVRRSRRDAGAPSRPGRRRCARSPAGVGRERVAELPQLGLTRWPGASTTSAPKCSRQNRASSSDSAPRSRWLTWSAETPYPSARSTCHRHVESAPPETRQVTSPPGAIRSRSRMNASTRVSIVVLWLRKGGCRGPGLQYRRPPARAAPRVSGYGVAYSTRPTFARGDTPSAASNTYRIGNECATSRIVSSGRSSSTRTRPRTARAISPRCSPPTGASSGPRPQTHSR